MLCHDRLPCQRMIILVLTGLLCTTNVPAKEPTTDEIRRAAEVTPSKEQLALARMEYYAFVHFNLSTFVGGFRASLVEKQPAERFNPTDLDARQWARVCKDAGMGMIVMVVKHHDGFSLWPSQYTEYSVKNSPWRGGRGDLVKEVADACRAEGLKFGIYMSPWDAHDPRHGTPAYDTYFKNQLRELLSNYGEISEVWFDGYGADKHQHDWHGYNKLIHELQPTALIRAGLEPAIIKGLDVRWFGKSERSLGVRETEWSVIPLRKKDFTKEGYYRNFQKNDLGSRKKLAGAERMIWWQAEFDIPIRLNWFYHDDDKPKSLEYLLDVYFKSVGRNATFLLNISPDRRGLIPDEDIERLQELRAALDAIFRENLAADADASASDLRRTEGGPDFAHDAGQTVDGDLDTYWTVDEGTTSATIEYDLGEPKKFNVATLQEYIPVGQRIEEFVLEASQNGKWTEISRATTVGHKRILTFDDVVAQKVRVRILQSRVCPTLANFGLYYQQIK